MRGVGFGLCLVCCWVVVCPVGVWWGYLVLCCGVWVCVWVFVYVLLPLLLLHDLCAGASGLFMSAGITWSAVHWSSGLYPSPHNQQIVALSRTCLAALR